MTLDYDANNVRVKKTQSGISTYYFYAQNGNLILEYTPGKGEAKQYGYLGAKQIAMRRLWSSTFDLDKDGIIDAQEIKQLPGSITAGENLTFYHPDQVGSPIMATTHPDGVISWRENYKPYGERQVRSITSSTNNNWFAGKTTDTESGLSYFGARYYDPLIGRFMSVDPAEPNPNNLHSLNRYAYANNNPYKYVDPDGRDPNFVLMIDPTLFMSDIAPSLYNVDTSTWEGVNIATKEMQREALYDMGGMVASGIIGKFSSAFTSKMVRSLEQVADDALMMGKNTGAAAELRVGDKTYTAVSGESVPHNDQVTAALMGTPHARRAPWHGGCAEIACLDKALNDGSIRAINIGNTYGNHASSKPICTSCQDILNYFGVNY